MLKLNIIPIQLKKEIKNAKVFELLRRMVFFVISFVLIYAAIFISSNQILHRYAKDTFSNQESIGKNSTEYIEKVKNINEQIDNVAKVQKEFVPFSDFVLEITEKINPGIKINQLTIDKETNNFILSGTADSRDSLLKLKSDLEALGYFYELNLPINNLLKKDDINFSISAKISKYGK